MIEAELKAVVRDPEAVMSRLEDAHGPGQTEVYQDTYYDTPTGVLADGDRELRIRTVHAADDTCTVLRGLGIEEGDLTTELYTDAVAAACRAGSPEPGAD